MDDGDELRHLSTSPNAETRMNIASVDAISELVWSPRNGLRLRCADFTFTRKTKLLSPNFFDIGKHTNMTTVYSNSSSNQQQQEETGFSGNLPVRTRDLVVMDRIQDDVNQACSGRSIEMNRPLSGIGGSVEEKVEVNDDVDSEEAETRPRDSPEATLLANEQLRVSQEEAVNHEENTRVVDGNRLEVTDENDLATISASKALVACESKGECFPKDVEEAGPSCSYRVHDRAKGKEKALSDGNFEEEDESFGSVESCNSAGLFSRGKKRAGFEQQLIIGSKRLKTLSQECLGSTSKLKQQDSSFMNWISNMTKGIWKGNEEDNPNVVPLTTITSDANGQVHSVADQQQMTPYCQKENIGCRNTGFQSFFQSIYCLKKRSQDDASSQELLRLHKQYHITNGEHLSSSHNEIGLVAETHTSGKIGPDQANETTHSSENKETNTSLLLVKPDEEEKAQCLTNRNSGLESLWISRFASRSSLPQKKDVATEANDSASDVAKTRGSQKTFPPPLLRIESSEAIASMFATTIEALRNMLPLNSEKGHEGLVCLYCGKKGHRLHDCLEVTDSELRELVQNVSDMNGREDVSSLCIRCFQLSHWAATCPNLLHTLASTSGSRLPLKRFMEGPKTVFESVQLLRLTRTDIIKWMNTKNSVSGLEGFFLRLRLGKWEEGRGGTGYYVARIDGYKEGQIQKENSSVSVKVGGMSCFVESQFISNQDFLEEELKAWWQSATKSAGDGIPSEEELSRKIQQRKMLGF